MDDYIENLDPELKASEDYSEGLVYVDNHTEEYIWHTTDPNALTVEAADWQELWENAWFGNNTVDPLQSAADYYILFGIINDSFIGGRVDSLPTDEEIMAAGQLLGLGNSTVSERLIEFSLERAADPSSLIEGLKAQSNDIFIDLVNKLDAVFKDYAHLAVGGEVRHHISIKKNEMYDYCSRRQAWSKWFYIFKEHGPEALTHMSKLFREIRGESIGGEAWAQASDILYMRETGQLGPDEFTNKQLFVDRVFTLEHNNGCFLNKLEWKNYRMIRQGFSSGLHGMAAVLDAHCSDPPDINRLYGYASEDIQELLKTYLELATALGIEILADWEGDAEDEADKKPEKQSEWIDWSDHTDIDQPDTSWLYDLALDVPATTDKPATYALVGGNFKAAMIKVGEAMHKNVLDPFKELDQVQELGKTKLLDPYYNILPMGTAI